MKSKFKTHFKVLVLPEAVRLLIERVYVMRIFCLSVDLQTQLSQLLHNYWIYKKEVR